MIISVFEMARIEVVSFDAEGTLVTPDFSTAIWHEAIPALYAQKKGMDFDSAKKCIVEEYDKVGDHRLEWYDIEYWFRCLDLGPCEPVIEACLDKIRYYPEAKEVISSLAGKYRLIVASGTPLKLLRLLLKDIENHFAGVFSSVSHYRQVKSPEFYLKICEEMGVHPSRVVHVGDNWQFDVQNPQKCGIQAYHVDRLGKNHQESINDLRQLRDFLLSSE